MAESGRLIFTPGSLSEENPGPWIMRILTFLNAPENHKKTNIFLIFSYDFVRKSITNLLLLPKIISDGSSIFLTNPTGR
jgi:hypothetical protein